MRFTTRVIHYAEEPDYGRSGDVIHPIHLSTTGPEQIRRNLREALNIPELQILPG